MKNKLGILLTALLALLSISILAGGGSAEDPLVSVSYLETAFTRPYQKTLNDTTYEMYWTAVEDFEEVFLTAVDDMLRGKDKASAVAQRLYQDWLEDPARLTMNGPVNVTLKQGDRVVGVPGSQFILLSGTASAYDPSDNGLVDLHQGAAVPTGTEVGANRIYMICESDRTGATVTSETAELRLSSGAYVVEHYPAKYEAKADVLKELGLFLGSGTGYDLEREPTRQEALIMLIRMLGEEKAAAAYGGGSRFTDLTGWEGGKNYIAYGASKGYTSGTTATTFSQYELAGLDTYLTFLLRALGYSDAKGDFVWNRTSQSLAVQIGLMTQEQLDDALASGFYRDHVVIISYNALNTSLKDGSMTLGQKLVKAGVITQDQLALVK